MLWWYGISSSRFKFHKKFQFPRCLHTNNSSSSQGLLARALSSSDNKPLAYHLFGIAPCILHLLLKQHQKGLYTTPLRARNNSQSSMLNCAPNFGAGMFRLLRPHCVKGDDTSTTILCKFLWCRRFSHITHFPFSVLPLYV